MHTEWNQQDLLTIFGIPLSWINKILNEFQYYLDGYRVWEQRISNQDIKVLNSSNLSFKVREKYPFIELLIVIRISMNNFKEYLSNYKKLDQQEYIYNFISFYVYDYVT